MRRKIYFSLMIIFIAIAGCAAIHVNEFASIAAGFACIAALICYIKGMREPEPYWDDPQWDATNAAHPAWWRGEKSGAMGFAKIINDVLLDRNKCTGRMEPTLEAIRNSVFKLKQERDRLFKRCEILQEQNQRQATTIGQYQNGNEKKNLLKQINELFEKIGALKIDLHYALEQRRTDWDRIKQLEQQLQEERAVNKSSFQTIDDLGKTVEELKTTIKRGCW